MHLRITLLFLSISIFPAGFAQVNQPTREEDFSEVLQFTSSTYGVDQQLINGRYHEYKYRYAEGHPFLRENEFSEGEMVLRGKEYRSIDMKYDIYHQELIVNTIFGNQQVSFYPPIEFVNSFRFDGKMFEKRSFNTQPPAYYQVVAEEEQISCLYSWFKTREESYHNITFSSYKFSKSKHNTYLVIDNTISQYRNNRSFKKIFPEPVQSNLSSYLKSAKVSVRKATDREMEELITYCQTLLNGLKTQ